MSDFSSETTASQSSVCVDDTYGHPRAASNVCAAHLTPWVCPECNRPARTSYGIMGHHDNKARCAECFDDWRFGEDEELRAQAEKQYQHFAAALAGVGADVLNEVLNDTQDSATAEATEKERS